MGSLDRPRRKDIREAIEDQEEREELKREVQELMGCYELTEWESDFLDDIEQHLDRGFTSASGSILSDRQRAVIEEIRDKC